MTGVVADCGAIGEQGVNFRFGEVVFSGKFAGVEGGDELREISGLERDAADLLGLAEGGELRGVEWAGSRVVVGCWRGWSGVVGHFI